MQVKQITVEVSRTHNLGSYSNIKPTVSILVHLDEGDDPEKVIAETRRMALKQVRQAILDPSGDPDNEGEVTEDDLPF